MEEVDERLEAIIIIDGRLSVPGIRYEPINDRALRNICEQNREVVDDLVLLTSRSVEESVEYRGESHALALLAQAVADSLIVGSASSDCRLRG